MSKVQSAGGLLVLVGILAACSPAYSGAESLRTLPRALVVISANESTFRRGEDVIVHVMITNIGTQTIGVLKWFTPLAGVERSLFTVQLDGVSLPYMGKLVKRAAPTLEDYVLVAGGESLKGDVDLSASYDLSVSGKYVVIYDISSPQLFGEEDTGKQQQPHDGSHLISNTLQIMIK